MILKPGRLPVDLGWRVAFAIGAMIGLGILFMRRHVPESPRWLVIHGCQPEAEAIVDEIEKKASVHPEGLPEPENSIRIRTQRYTPWREIWQAMAHEHRRRSVLGFSLMVTQACFYNAVLFTYGLVLLR